MKDKAKDQADPNQMPRNVVKVINVLVLGAEFAQEGIGLNWRLRRLSLYSRPGDLGVSDCWPHGHRRADRFPANRPFHPDAHEVRKTWMNLAGRWKELHSAFPIDRRSARDPLKSPVVNSMGAWESEQK
jgi:hypothetical protein